MYPKLTEAKVSMTKLGCHLLSTVCSFLHCSPSDGMWLLHLSAHSFRDLYKKMTVF